MCRIGNQDSLDPSTKYQARDILTGCFKSMYVGEAQYGDKTFLGDTFKFEAIFSALYFEQ